MVRKMRFPTPQHDDPCGGADIVGFVRQGADIVGFVRQGADAGSLLP